MQPRPFKNLNYKFEESEHTRLRIDNSSVPIGSFRFLC